MPRSNWKGSISFGLVNIPIVLFNSENPSEKLAFHQIDKRDNARIKYQRINVDTEKEVPWDEIGKGYEYAKGEILPVDESELKNIAGDNARTIAIEEFVPATSIHFVDLYKTYYLLPDKKGDKGYVILREALNKTKKIGIAKVIISTKEYLAAISAFDNGLMLYLLHYPEEIRPMNSFDFPSENLKDHHVNAKEVAVAIQLVNAMSTKWQPKKYKDEYQATVREWVAEKLKTNKPHVKMQNRNKTSKKPNVVGFVELLKKSLKHKPAKNDKRLTVVKRKSNGKRASMH